MPALILAMALTPAPMVAPAGPTAASARAFLQSIYAFYRKGKYGAPLDKPERWYEPVLAKAIRADMAQSEKSGDIGKIDADFFCDCQDFDDIRAVVGPVAVKGKKATADVSFVNGEPRKIHFTLVATPAGWRVYDVDWGEDGSVRELFFGKGRP